MSEVTLFGDNALVTGDLFKSLQDVNDNLLSVKRVRWWGEAAPNQP
jgi:hypothetical protein